jgi:hypothetical protein
MIKFNKFNVTNGIDKARVFYSKYTRADGQECVVLYSKDYDRALGRIFSDEYVNNTDSMTDYFERGQVVLLSGHPLYAAAAARAN